MIEEAGSILFFGVGAGRCGTMSLANALSMEPGVVCTHEGKRRDFERPGKQLLPFLTLQNRVAYEYPDRAQALFDAARVQMPRIGAEHGASGFGDIAYNYAPFIDSITCRFPRALLIAIFRNGVDFVRSATQDLGIDETPVGWAPESKELTPVEKFVALGRLAPRAGSDLLSRWENMDHFARNAWLWAETNRLILSGISRRPAGSTLVLRFEDFFSEASANFPGVRNFLRLRGDPGPEALRRLSMPINRRPHKTIGPFETWSPTQRDLFEELAGSMMRELDYPMN